MNRSASASRTAIPFSAEALRPGVRALVLRLQVLNQKGGAAIQAAAKKVDAALGIGPILHNNKLQLFVKEFFSGLFVLRIDFQEVGDNADRIQILCLTFCDSGEQPLHRLGRVSCGAK